MSTDLICVPLIPPQAQAVCSQLSALMQEGAAASLQTR